MCWTVSGTNAQNLLGALPHWQSHNFITLFGRLYDTHFEQTDHKGIEVSLALRLSISWRIEYGIELALSPAQIERWVHDAASAGSLSEFQWRSLVAGSRPGFRTRVHST
jgi:hypothetical protein